jgi:hypothetical protein
VYPPDSRSKEFQKIIDNVEYFKQIESVNYRSFSALRLTTGRDHLDDVNLILQNLNEFEVNITQINRVGEFWAQIKEKEREVEKIKNLLNSRHKKLQLLDKNTLRINQLAATLFYDQNNCLIARVKILKLEENHVEVFYIDYGNYEKKDYNLIFDIYQELKNIPHQVISLKKDFQPKITICLILFFLKALKFQLIKLRINPLRRPEDNDVGKFSHLLANTKLKAKVKNIIL